MLGHMVGAGATAYAQQRAHYDRAIRRQREACLQMRRQRIKGSAPKRVIPLAGYIGAMQISGTFYPIRMGKTNIPQVKHGNR